MPCFTIILSGHGIDLAIDGIRAKGFFTTRVIEASSIGLAESQARERVLADWQDGGQFAGGNHGQLPTLGVEQSFRMGWFAGLFGRRPRGYTFYRDEDDAVR